VITRKIRDTNLTRRMKRRFDWKYAICGKCILLPNGEYYAEAHHIRPLGGGHEGTEENIILCPSHHAEFDNGSIAINPENLSVTHYDGNNLSHGKTPEYSLSYLFVDYLTYHFRLFDLQSQ